MLHAVNSRKARLEVFRGAGIRVPVEDVVTSTVFGPLEFMSDDDRRRSVDLICEALGFELSVQAGTLEVAFWPCLHAIDGARRSRHSEPDLMIADEVGPLVVFEVKWGAPLSAHELASQWASLGSVGRRRAVHVLLVQEQGAYRSTVDVERETVDAAGLGPWNLLVRSWRSLVVIELLSRRGDTSRPVRTWASAVSAFLRREHRATMHGWDGIALTEVEECSWTFRLPWLARLDPVDEVGGWWTDG